MVKKARADRKQERRRALVAFLPVRWWAWCLVLAGLTAAGVVHVRARLVAVELGYGLSEAATRNRELQAERRKLMVELATLRNPRRLRTLAVEQLRLVEPSPGQILTAPKDVPSELALGN